MDQLLIGLIKDRPIRVYLVNSSASSKEICALHHTTPVVSDALSRLVSVGAMMSGMLKDKKSSLTLKIMGNGPIEQLLVVATAKGTVRGFVSNPNVSLPLNKKGQLDVGKAVGDLGVLTVIKEMGLVRDFTGDVILMSGEIGDDFCYYFMKSEQTPSSVVVGAIINRDQSVKTSGGMIIQLMPSAEEEDIVYAENVTKKITSISKMLDAEGDVTKLATSIFGSDLDILEVSPIKFQCDCSKERFIRGIATLTRKEIAEMLEEDHGCDIKCEFCNRNYHLTEADLMEALKIRGMKN
ncbi:MAG: Hsp33 family molecular chaperone HslO [Bacilli bacterium]|jgi:molecular chaperone Hsp33|nr:Hsp33 family molecular chaperone HslO [Bacilli bacterium]MDD4065684.1 Hsp33 family molecular chaperone HslO [Bacilli bacterium]